MSFTGSKSQAEAANSFRSLLSNILPDLLREVDGSSKVEKVKAALRDVSQNYRTGLSTASLRYRTDWKEAANRCAYVFVYLIQHCNLVFYSLMQASERGTVSDYWSDLSTLNVCSVGGGPGSDLVGLTTFLEQSHVYPRMLNCLVLDLYPTWKRAWDAIAYYLPRQHWVSYKRCDLVGDAGLSADVLQFVRDADLVTLVKSFSAAAAFLRADRSRGSALRAILREIKPGCHVLYIDNDHDGDSQFRNDFADPAGLDLMFEERDFQSVPSGSYSEIVNKYCSALDFNPMKGCDVNIQLYRKKFPVKKYVSSGYTYHTPQNEIEACCCGIFGGLLCIAVCGLIGYGVYRLIRYIF
ncbi:uncharacterized protein LOC119743014 [Patiria miniata]|uniref:Uncharacterized protein n=1 Tax=Patiria miniata TaxID=46514 RepID=A0A914BGM6_PATMI|nr:uncharacterized protein LOC119743014 [Patiria miniata]